MQNRKPMVLVFAGPNGSGKSTITSFFEKVGRYTNADDIVMSTEMTNIDPAINILRIESRVASGGHDVEHTKVIDRYYKSLGHIKELIDICDILHVYDNTESPKRIIRKHKDDLSIYPNEYWTDQDIIKLLG